jgi:hypothetical protein
VAKSIQRLLAPSAFPPRRGKGRNRLKIRGDNNRRPFPRANPFTASKSNAKVHYSHKIHPTNSKPLSTAIHSFFEDATTTNPRNKRTEAKLGNGKRSERLLQSQNNANGRGGTLLHINNANSFFPFILFELFSILICQNSFYQ